MITTTTITTNTTNNNDDGNDNSKNNHHYHKHTTTTRMSVTTTDNPVSTTLHRAVAADHLHDYEVHLTNHDDDDDNDNEAVPAAAPNSLDAPRPAASYPPGWPSDARGYPPYRPINTGLDRASRPWGGSPVGDAFVFTMFTGVFTIAVSCSW